jgi:putative spermidine/putrescine transport system substrate-binding protein
MASAREAAFMPATRRSLLTASIGLAMPYIPAAEAAPRSVTFAAYGGLFQELYEPAVVQPFGRLHRDIDVFWYALPSAAQTLALLRRQHDLPEIDVVLLDLAAARTATEEGLLEPLSAASMPVLGELAPGTTFPGVAGPALFTEPLVMLFDAARARPDGNWKALWSTTEKRSIAIAAPPDPAGIAFAVVAARLFGGGNAMHALQDGITAIGELARHVVTWDPSPDVYRYIGEGNAKLGVGWNMPAQIWSDRLGGRLGVVFPAEGTLSRVITVNLVKRSRQPEAARQLISWLLGAEAQRTMVETMFLGPVNAHTKYVEGALQRTANTPERVAHAMPVDWVTVDAMREAIVRRWHEVVPDAG